MLSCSSIELFSPILHTQNRSEWSGSHQATFYKIEYAIFLEVLHFETPKFHTHSAIEVL